MSRAEILGRWYCHTVDQEQSDEEAEAYGEHDDFREPQKASKTEHAQTTLDLHEDGTFELRGAEDYMGSKGTWEHDGSDLSLTEVEAAGGYDGLEYAYLGGSDITVAFKLVPDAHDGLDVLVLRFGREPPAVRGPRPEGLVDRLATAEDDDELWQAVDEALDEQGRDPGEVARELWDAVADGRLLGDPDSDSYYGQISVLGDDRLREAGGFTHDHALHLLQTVSPGDGDLANLLVDMIGTLPADPRDEELAPRLSGEWIGEFAQGRFLGGGTPEALFHRPIFPQPQMDEACRAYALRSEYTRFESIPRLFPPGHPDAARVAIRYRGRGLLAVPLAFIRERDLRAPAREAALVILGDEGNARWLGRWQSACIFAVVLSVELGVPLPEVVITGLELEAKGMMMGSMDPEERALIKGMIAELPAEARELVTRRLFLDRG
ncbi:MAG: hypothetical protein H6712_30835 [Myxococcales bacterium]|nr:hypothetical protein [Myxococcales bacterium]MCB9718287.1 hypothetical protein [Myxococcales bacterium]